jgi:Tol biopolymer transport system component
MRSFLKARYSGFIRIFQIAGISITLIAFTGCSKAISDFTILEQQPQIFPDYTSLVIPSNIAPLNFNINEKGSEFQVDIYSKNGEKIRFRQSSPKIEIPVGKWHDLLDKNKGNTLFIDVYSKQDKWYKYATITDTIAMETIDNHLVYRLIGIVYTYFNKMGIYQQNLENFEKSIIYENTSHDKKTCVNCHSFSNNNPGKMSMHIRTTDAGTVIFNDGKLNKYNTKTKYTISPASYAAWHPNGELIAYSVNQLIVNFTSFPDKIVEVWDKASDLVIFNVKTNTITKPPKISTPSRENLPNWSPDGKWLYFISAPKANEDGSNLIKAKYDLLRIAFDADKMSWGEIDTLLTAKETGMSITFPIASPDGRYILFCMIDHSYFSIFDKKSDLYLFDLTTRQYRKLDILNSPETDSYHSWSKNGRWVVFSSKRINGLTTQPHFAYFDNNGKFHKPFVLPQKDPLFYMADTWNYNLPVMVDGKVDINANEFRDFVSEPAEDAKFGDQSN